VNKSNKERCLLRKFSRALHNVFSRIPNVQCPPCFARFLSPNPS
jgi:hypothetical protein